METLDINLSFGVGISQARSRASLKEIIESCESAISSKVKRSGADNRQSHIMRAMVPTYFGVFHSIDDKLKQEYHLFAGNNPQQARWSYAINRSARAVVNSLDDASMKALRSHLDTDLASLITAHDFMQDTDFKIHKTILENLTACGKGNHALGLQNAYLQFFNQIALQSENALIQQANQASLEKLESIVILKQGLSFKRPEKIEKSENKITSPLRGDKELATSLIPYHPDPRAKVENLIGNEHGLLKLQASLIRGVTYDPIRQKNPFTEDGSRLKDVLIFYGQPGVGKNMTFDAACNWAKDLFVEYNKKWSVNDLKTDLLTSYISRMAGQFRRYVDLMSKSDHFNVGFMNEADSLTRGKEQSRHEETTKLIGEMKEAIDQNRKGNILYVFLTNYPDEFETAFKSRAEFIKLDGPVTKEDFGNLFYIELKGTTNGNGPASNLIREDYLQIGTLFHEYRQSFNDRGMTPPVTGRDAHNVASNLLQGDDMSVVNNSRHILSRSNDRYGGYEGVAKIKQALVPKITRPDIEREIHRYFASRKGANQNYC